MPWNWDPFCSVISHDKSMEKVKKSEPTIVAWKKRLKAIYHTIAEQQWYDNGEMPKSIPPTWFSSAKLFKKCIGNTRFPTIMMDGWNRSRVINRNVQALVTFLASTSGHANIVWKSAKKVSFLYICLIWETQQKTKKHARYARINSKLAHNMRLFCLISHTVYLKEFVASSSVCNSVQQIKLFWLEWMILHRITQFFFS